MVSSSHPGKRERLARFADRGGLTRLLETLPRSTCLMVLSYHRVTDPEQCPYDRGVIAATPQQFDDQVTYLKRRFPVIGLDEALDLVDHPDRLRRPCVMLTFDDCYRDNYETAFPILKSHGLSAVFFMPTSFVGTDHIPWWDQIAFMVRNTSRKQIRLEYPTAAQFDVSTDGTEAVIWNLLRIYKSPETMEPVRCLAGIAEACEVDLPRAANPRLFMNWEEAAKMVQGGMAFGSHTHSHELLAKLTLEQQVEEVCVSRDVLRRRLGIAGDALAYPVGSPASFTSVTQGELEKAGYRAAFSHYGGVNRPNSLRRFDILRLKVDRQWSLQRYRLFMTLAALTARNPL